MADNISRRKFLKGAAGTVGAVALGTLATGCKPRTGKGLYTPGTYSATATGVGEVTATLTFSEDKITDVVLDVSHESKGIGTVVGDDLAKAIMKAQSAEVDGVSGATMTSNAVKTAVDNCIAQAKGQTVVSTVSGATEAAGEDWLGEEPQISKIDEVKEVDVVVVGAGLAGICTARSAAEEGAKVALIEKSATMNVRSGEYALLNGSLNKRWRRENIVDTNTVVDRLVKETTYRTKRPIYSKWAEHGHEAMDWFLGAYPELTICDSTREKVTQEQYDKGILVPLSWPLPENYNYKEEDFPTFPSSMEFRSSRRDQQGFIAEAQLKDAIKNGTEVFYGCFGKKLLKEDSGRITGIVVERAEDGKYIQFNAKMGVVLATGDNSADDKIMNHFTPEVMDKKIARMATMGILGVDVKGDPISTGDGLRMGAWAGAKVQDFHAPMTHHMGGGEPGQQVGITPFLQINKHGERFMNECIPGQQLENQIELQPEHTSFQIYDSNWGNQIPFMPANHGGLCYIIPEDEDMSHPNAKDRQYTTVSDME
ncbi:MAG: FAD-dependent oxidoreductase, partial [Spirochaetales bacterium]|nr:FAD-dependent oxidoreductase [Spirochaetales bacterium]